MARDIDQWLEGLGLGRYAEVFAENDIGPDVLPRLTEEHLKELGVSLGDRVRLLKAIEALEATQADVPEASPPSELTASVAVPAANRAFAIAKEVFSEAGTQLPPGRKS